MNVPVIKVWNVDYSFLIKNYLDERLWNHTWTLFEYCDYVITLEMQTIHTCRKVIEFDIKITHKKSGENSLSYVDYFLKSDTVDFFIRRLNGRIFHLIEEFEKNSIRKSDAYETIEVIIENERERLTQIAEDFLDDEDITNEEIREMYIENYIDRNSEAAAYRYNFMESSKYHYLTDFYLVFLQSIKDDERQQKVLDALNIDERENVLKQIEEYEIKMQTEEYEKEMKMGLETIREEYR